MARPGAPPVLTRHRFDVREYHEMIRAGILDEDHRTELLDGEIVEMHGIGSRHFACVMALQHALARALDDRALVSVQGPIRLSRYSEPEPDIAVLRPRADFYAQRLPGPQDTLLVIEVGDSSLLKDRVVKLPLYAGAGIPETWIVDLTRNVLEVHGEPVGDTYECCARHRDDQVRLRAFPDVWLDVAALLPRLE